MITVLKYSPLETRRARLAVLAGITLLALALRLWGISWGAPERLDFHPDERKVVNLALAVSPAKPDPGFLNYPAFLMYVIAGASASLRLLGWLTEDWHAFLVGRAIVAVFGAATVPAVFGLANALGATPLGAVLAALWMALLPLHVWESHTAVTDVPMTFWIVVTLLASIRLLHGGRWRDYAWVGAALGLAVGTKYTAALALVGPVAAAAARRPRGRALAGLGLAGLVALGTCFAVTPYSFLRFPDLLRAMAFEHAHVMSHHYGFSIPAAGVQYHRYVYQLVAAWPFSLGLALYASAAAGTAWAVRRIDARRVLLLGFVVVFFGVTGSWSFTPLRYYLPVLAVGAVFAGVWQGDWIASGRPLYRGIAWMAVLATALYTGAFTVDTTARYADDTRLQAARWLDGTLHPDTRLLVAGWPPYVGLPANAHGAHISYGTDGTLQELPPHDFDLVEISSLHYLRARRHSHPDHRPAYDRLRAKDSPFRLVKRFEAHFLHRALYARLDPMFESYFVSPTLEFYAPRSAAESAALW